MPSVLSGGYQGDARVQPPPPPQESIINRLSQICETLARAENILCQIAIKVDGPFPENNNKLVESPQTLNAFIMEINSKAQRLVNELDRLNGGI